jgi:hypothetical protein
MTGTWLPPEPIPSSLQLKGNDIAVDLVRLVKPAALLPLMNARFEGTRCACRNLSSGSPSQLAASAV